MKSSRVWTTPDDVRVTPVVSVSQFKRVRDDRVHFVFPLRVSRSGPRALMRFYADVDRVLQDAHLHRRLYESHLGEDGPRVFDTEA
jgi:hypothetical protein